MGKQREKTNTKRPDKKSRATTRTVNKKNKDVEKEQGEDTGNNFIAGNEERDFPSKEREEIPYIGDNPDETEKESPKLNG